MLISLLEHSRNPVVTAFVEYPHLNTIWTPELSKMAGESITEWENDLHVTGKVYLIRYLDKVIGIFGWYEHSNNEIGLRWFGIISEYRKRGYAKQAFELLLKTLPDNFEYVYEVTRSAQSKEFFIKCGFEEVMDVQLIQHAVSIAEYSIDDGGWVLVKRIR